MRNFEKLDETALKAFYFAAETLSFTKAAEAAALTQSGISQHISRLEEELNVSLFIRASRKVQLTEAGSRLKRFAENYLDEIDTLLEDLRSETRELRGLVKYAMPNSCLMTPHFPILLEKRKAFPGVDLKLTICHSPEVLKLLISGEIDFGFVTDLAKHNDIEYFEFAQEEYALVSSSSSERLIFDSLANLKEKKFINYPGMDILFEKWQQSNFPRSKKIKLSNLKIAGEVNNLDAAIHMASHGMGLAVFPQHCVQGLLQEKKLKKFNSKGEKNSIYIVKLKGQKTNSRVQKVLDTFWEMVN